MDASVNLFSLVKNNETFMRSVDPFIQQLKTYCNSLCHSKWDGEDLFQETMFKAFKKWRDQPYSLTKGYLFRIASNTWIDLHRKNRLNVEGDAELGQIPGREAVNKDEIEAAMSVLLQKLTSKQRTVLLLTEGFGCTPGEIAEMLGCSEGSVRTALHRARKNLEKVSDDDSWTEHSDIEDYVEAFYSYSPTEFVDIYKYETSDVRAFVSPVSFISGRNVFVYHLVPITIAYREVFLLFNRAEWLILLTRLKRVAQHMAICA